MIKEKDAEQKNTENSELRHYELPKHHETQAAVLIQEET